MNKIAVFITCRYYVLLEPKKANCAYLTAKPFYRILLTSRPFRRLLQLSATTKMSDPLDKGNAEVSHLEINISK